MTFNPPLGTSDEKVHIGYFLCWISTGFGKPTMRAV